VASAVAMKACRWLLVVPGVEVQTVFGLMLVGPGAEVTMAFGGLSAVVGLAVMTVAGGWRLVAGVAAITVVVELLLVAVVAVMAACRMLLLEGPGAGLTTGFGWWSENAGVGVITVAEGRCLLVGVTAITVDVGFFWWRVLMWRRCAG